MTTHTLSIADALTLAEHAGSVREREAAMATVEAYATETLARIADVDPEHLGDAVAGAAPLFASDQRYANISAILPRLAAIRADVIGTLHVRDAIGGGAARLTQSAVADRLGITQGRVSQILTTVRETCKCAACKATRKAKREEEAPNVTGGKPDTGKPDAPSADGGKAGPRRPDVMSASAFRAFLADALTGVPRAVDYADNSEREAVRQAVREFSDALRTAAGIGGGRK